MVDTQAFIARVREVRDRNAAERAALVDALIHAMSQPWTGPVTRGGVCNDGEAANPEAFSGTRYYVVSSRGAQL